MCSGADGLRSEHDGNKLEVSLRFSNFCCTAPTLYLQTSARKQTSNPSIGRAISRTVIYTLLDDHQNTMKFLVRSSIPCRALLPFCLRSVSLLPTSQSIFQISSRQRCITTTTNTPSETEHPALTPVSASLSSNNAATSYSIEHFEPLSYHVHRTPSQQLPVYQLAKAGGNKHLTRLRKISGSVEDLKDDLRIALGLAEKDIVINNVNRHIVIKVCIMDHF